MDAYLGAYFFLKKYLELDISIFKKQHIPTAEANVVNC
jgi:hypothetical protein